MTKRVKIAELKAGDCAYILECLKAHPPGRTMLGDKWLNSITAKGRKRKKSNEEFIIRRPLQYLFSFFSKEMILYSKSCSRPSFDVWSNIICLWHFWCCFFAISFRSLGKHGTETRTILLDLQSPRFYFHCLVSFI